MDKTNKTLRILSVYFKENPMKEASTLKLPIILQKEFQQGKNININKLSETLMNIFTLMVIYTHVHIIQVC